MDVINGQHLYSKMAIFLTQNNFGFSTQDKRISVTDALAHPYLDEGRLRYHSCMCKCCFTTSSSMRQYTGDFEPAASQLFDDLWERKLTSVQQVKGMCVERSICLGEDVMILTDFLFFFPPN